MERTIIERNLALADERVTLSTEHVRQQREILADLDRAGRPTDQARRLLGNFEDLLALHVASRDEIRSELARHPK